MQRRDIDRVRLSYHKSGQTRVDLELKGYNWQRWKIKVRKTNSETIAITDEKISSGKGKDRKSI